MNCDEVFDLLTRGPIPAGDPADDAAVESHLGACHDCRRLAEALRPAVDLFHEALDDDVADGLPCYRGELPVAEGTVAVLAPPRRERRDEAPRDRRRVGVGVLALGIAGVMALAWVEFGRSPAGSSDPLPAALQRVDHDREQRLVDLGMSARCRPAVEVRDAAGNVLECCAVCHGPDHEPTKGTTPVALLTKSCSVCHDEPATETTDRWSGDWSTIAVSDLRG